MRIGKSVEFYTRSERGNALPSVPTLLAMRDALGVTVDQLLSLDLIAEHITQRSVLAGLPRALVRLARRLIKLDRRLRRVVAADQEVRRNRPRS